jgi:hypothetical protein
MDRLRDARDELADRDVDVDVEPMRRESKRAWSSRDEPAETA